MDDACVQSFWVLGALAEVALASRILVPWGWQWLLGSAALPFGAHYPATLSCTVRALDTEQGSQTEMMHH